MEMEENVEMSEAFHRFLIVFPLVSGVGVYNPHLEKHPVRIFGLFFNKFRVFVEGRLVFSL